MNEKRKNKLSAHDSMAHEWNLEKSSLHQFLRQDLLISLKKYLSPSEYHTGRAFCNGCPIIYFRHYYLGSK